ncbi:MAG: HAMP domain-containing protein [Desulfuromonadales bacterium]|nr:HAMP domain-containing protein [Desulfuromonadales bacterium]
MSCTVLLLIVSGILIVVEFYANRATLTQEIQTLATSLAANSSRSLVLGKYSDVEEVLSSLDQQKNIHAAYMFDQDGQAVAEYLKQQDSQFVLSALQHDFQAGNHLSGTGPSQRILLNLSRFSYFQPVYFQDKAAGTLYLLSDLNSFYARLNGVFSGISISFLVLLLLSWLLARRLHQPISEPLMQLTEIMTQVSGKQDFSLRAPKNSGDEIGVLVDGFNHMLEQIEKQRHKLTQHQFHLEQLVAEKTVELRLTVKKLESARKRADAANAAKSDFLSKMTHELRTPLIGVLGMNELLQRTSLDEQQIMLTETVHNSGEELLRLINDVLDLSRIEAGRLTLKPAAVDLHQVIEDVVQLLFPEAQRKNLYLSVEMPLQACWKIFADQGRIRQVLVNVVGNAIKFTSTGGVTLNVQIDRQTDHEALFEIRVVDTGIGIDDKVKGQIFDVFYQADGAAGTRQKNGSGLGLAIVRQLVDLMEGELDFTSAPGQGSCFRVRLSCPLLKKVDYSLPADLSGKTVLLCSKHPHSGHELKKRLEALQFKVDFAEDGSTGLYRLLAAARRKTPYIFAFIGADIELETGQKMYETLRSEPELQTLRVIVLSSHRGEKVDLSGAERQVFFPLSWSDLHTAICNSWESLHILPGPVVQDRQQRPTGISGHALLLVGHHAASRELLRLSLLDYFSDIMVADNFTEAGNLVEKQHFSGVCVDCHHMHKNGLLSLMSKYRGQLPPVVLFLEEHSREESFCSSCLQVFKPVDKTVVEDIIKPFLLSKDSRYSLRGA